MAQPEHFSPPSDDSLARAPAGPLLSIHMTSNRPGDFVDFLDRLERATLSPSSVEVVIKIDDTDEPMNRLLEKEVRARPFRIRHISTRLDGGFFSLWRCYDDLLKASDPNAYFVIGLNDEMHFKTQDWDTVLQKYVGLFPDDIFRLRTSPQRHRNYYDFWEPGFANDTSAFMTKKWLEIGGGWCPCNGPDTFQEYVAFYFGWLDRFNAVRAMRDFAINDLQLEGHGASRDLSGIAWRRRNRGALKSHFKLVSPHMQEEAARRAQKLHAHIWAHEENTGQFEIRDNRWRRRIEIVELHRGAVVHTLPYRLASLRIWLTNNFRKLNCGYYLAGGSTNPFSWPVTFMTYLAYRHPWLDSWFEFGASAGHSRSGYLSFVSRTLAVPSWLFGRVLAALYWVIALPRRARRVFRDAAYPPEGNHSRGYFIAHTLVRSMTIKPLRWLGWRRRGESNRSDV